MDKYICNDGNAEVIIYADAAQEAAQEYVDGGDWGDITETTYIDVWVRVDTRDIEELLIDLAGNDAVTDHSDDSGLYRVDGEAVPSLDLTVLPMLLDDCRIYLDTFGDLVVEHGCHSQKITIGIEPDVPDCAEGEDHDWRSPYEVLGGIRENPGVWGHGGGVIIRQVCAHCGRYRVTDTWVEIMGALQRDGSVTYEDADEKSEAWVASLLAEED